MIAIEKSARSIGVRYSFFCIILPLDALNQGHLN
jgi:hypothetical protein